MINDESLYNLSFSFKIGHSCKGQYISVRVKNELKKAVFRLPGKWRKSATTLASYSIKRIGSI